MNTSNNLITLLDALQIRSNDGSINIPSIFDLTPKFKVFLEYYKFGEEDKNGSTTILMDKVEGLHERIVLHS